MCSRNQSHEFREKQEGKHRKVFFENREMPCFCGVLTHAETGQLQLAGKVHEIVVGEFQEVQSPPCSCYFSKSIQKEWHACARRKKMQREETDRGAVCEGSEHNGVGRNAFLDLFHLFSWS